jgi:hypothetical protein
MHLESSHGAINPKPDPKDPFFEAGDSRYSTYQTEYKEVGNYGGGGGDFRELGIIDEIDENNPNNPRRMTYDTSTLKTKNRNKTIK